MRALAKKIRKKGWSLIKNLLVGHGFKCPEDNGNNSCICSIGATKREVKRRSMDEVRAVLSGAGRILRVCNVQLDFFQCPGKC